MKKKIAILGSTGSIGKSLIQLVLKDRKKFDIQLLTAHKNYKLLLKQAKALNVKNLIVSDKINYDKFKSLKLDKSYNIYNNYNSFNKIFNTKLDYAMCSIVGLDGLIPTLNIIKFTKNLAIANKEAIICGWNLIQKNLNLYKTKFVPVDSEHFSIWSSMNYNLSKINKIYLTASGGPFYKKKFKTLKNVVISDALNHPTWKMGKKISIDSATLINKIFEIIEAKKIFNIKYENLSIVIHPKSYVHSIIKYENGLINLVAHDTNMKIPILNSLNLKSMDIFLKNTIDLDKLNKPNFHQPKSINFPLIKLLKKIPSTDSLFETALVTANDYLVNLFLKNKIKFTEISKIMLKLVDTKKFKKYKYQYPSKIKMILKTKNEVEFYLKKIHKI